jgi:hypothetical protein
LHSEILKNNKLTSLVAVYACYKAKHLLIKVRLNNIVGCTIAISHNPLLLNRVIVVAICCSSAATI